MTGSRDDTEANREEILDAATRVFAEKGFHTTRMDDVVASSGLSKGTVYWHFKSKDGLLAAVMQRFLSMELRRLDRVMTQETSVSDSLITFVRQITDDLARLGPLMQLTNEFYAIALRKEWARKLLREYYAQFRKVLEEILQSGIDRGEFRQVPLQETSITLTGLLEGLILLWVVDPGTVHIGRSADAALRLVLGGLRARPAR